jgi:hypothetical protein
MMKPGQSNINQSTQKWENTRNKKGRTHVPKEPPKRANHKGNIKFPNPHQVPKSSPVMRKHIK